MALLVMNVGPTEFQFDEVVAGSELRFNFKLEYEDENNPGTYLPFDFTGYTFTGDIRKDVNSVVVESFSITAPGVDGAGWVDCVLTGAQTTALSAAIKCDPIFSIKMTPDSDPDAGITVVVGSLPIKKRATV